MNGTGRKPTTPNDKVDRQAAVEKRGRKPQRIVFPARDSEGREINVIFFHGPGPADLSEGEAITASEVIGWFRDAAPNWPEPANCRSLQSFVHQLNALRLSEPFCIDRHDPTTQRLERVKKAIRVLTADLPPLIEGARQASEMARQSGREPFVSEDRENAIADLLSAAQRAVGSFHWPTPRKRDEPWHDAAAVVAAVARAMWRNAGRQQAIGVNPTSPLVKLVGVALARIGEGQHNAEAIAKALRRHEGIVAEVIVEQDNRKS